jgi:hypothetical protein
VAIELVTIINGMATDAHTLRNLGANYRGGILPNFCATYRARASQTRSASHRDEERLDIEAALS